MTGIQRAVLRILAGRPLGWFLWSDVLATARAAGVRPTSRTLGALVSSDYAESVVSESGRVRVRILPAGTLALKASAERAATFRRQFPSDES